MKISVQESVRKCHNLTHRPQNLCNPRQQLGIFLDGCEFLFLVFISLIMVFISFLIIFNILSVSNCMVSLATPHCRF